MNTLLFRVPLLAAFVLWMPSLSRAEEVTLTPIMDAAVSEASPDRNYAASNLVVGRFGGDAWESYLRFDLSGIPVTAEITAAEIRFKGPNLGSGGTIELAVPLAAWSEGGITWANQPASSSLGQAALTVENPNTAHLVLGANALGYLQNTVRNAVPDRGLKLSLVDAGADDYLGIESRESANEPRLVVTYTPGEALPDFTAGLGAEQERLKAQLFQAPEAAAADYELVWNTKPGLRYQLWESPDLDQWDPVPGYPAEANALSEVYEVPVGPGAKFYRVEVLDEQAPEIVSHFPADGAFGIRRFYPSRSEIGVQLSDASGIDPDSISLNLGARGTFTLASPELTLQNGVLSFETGTDTALGNFGETVTATLTVADTLGQSATYTWSFEIEKELVLVDNLVIFGSAESQRAGQRVPYTPTRALAGDPGPVRANSNGWEIKEVTADSVVIAYDAGAPTFTAGQYLSNRTPRSVDEVFYRKVLSVADDAAQKKLTIFTEDVPAWEIMEEGTVSLSGDELAYEVDEAGNIVAARALKTFETSGEFQVDPVEINWSGKELAGFYTKPDNTTGIVMAGFHPDDKTGIIDFGLEEKAPGGAAWEGKLKLKQGRLTATPTISLAVKTGFFSLEKFHAECEMRIDAVVEPEFEFFSANLAGAGVKKTLWRHDFIIPIGGTLPIWVTVTPRINGKASFSAGLSGSVSVGARGGFTDTVILDLEKDREPWLEYDRQIGNPSFELLDPEIQLTGEIEASATLEPEIEVKLLSMVGFYVNVDPTVYANLSADFSTGSLLTAEASVGIRTNLNVGMAVTAVDDSLLPAFQAELFDIGWSWNFPEAPPEALLAILSQPQSTAVPPGGTLRLTVATNHHSGVSYEWRKDGQRLLDFGPELVRYGVGSGAAGDYQVIVRRAGSPAVNSDLATVTVGGGGVGGPVPAGFVEIPGGSFQMGDSFNEGESDERPVHTVNVSPFYMQSTEVTNAQMAAVMNWAHRQGLITASTSTVRNVDGNQQELLDMNASAIRLSWSGSEIQVDAGYEDHPVVEVTWYGAVAYCDFLTRMEGGGLTRCYDFSDWSCDFTSSGYRLPTEAEWEKAARLAASNAGETWRYPFGNSIDASKASYEGRGGGTQPVASYPATAGLYDMAGNVFEWCYDWYRYDANYYPVSTATDPTGFATGETRVLRGGSWQFVVDYCRVASRIDAYMTRSDSQFGFRPVRR